MASHPSRMRSAALALAATAALFAGTVELYANGGALRLAEIPMGEYRVSVFTDPTPVRPGTLRVSVLVVRPGIEGVAEDVDVRVRIDPEGAAAGHRELTATHEQAQDPRYRVAPIDLDAGSWEIEVHVLGEHGEGVASFQVTARERTWLEHPVTLAILALLPLAALGYWAFRTPEGASDSDDLPAESTEPEELK